MAKKYNVTVNGKTYTVEVEEQGITQSVTPVVSAPVVSAPVVAAPTQAPAPVVEAVEEPVASGAQGRVVVKSPMTGAILRILVSVGESVKENQPLMVLEAMKMENEIVALEAGTIASIDTTEGATVNTDDILATIN